MNPVRSLARAKGASLEDLGEATSNGMNKRLSVVLAISLVCAGLFIFSDIRAGTNHLIINQVQITGGSGKTTNDFIEFYNPTNSDIDLKGLRLVKRAKTAITDTLIKSWTSSVIIQAHGFYLWANSNFTDIAVPADVTTTMSIADDNGIALRDGPNDTGTVVDSIAWGEAMNAFTEVYLFPTNPVANESLERNLDDFTFLLQPIAHPRNSQSQTIMIDMQSTQTPTPSPSSTSSPTSTPSPSQTPTPSATPELTPSTTPTPISTPTPSATPEPEIIVTPSETPLLLPTYTLTPTPIQTPFSTVSPSPEFTPETSQNPEPTIAPNTLVAAITQPQTTHRKNVSVPVPTVVASSSLPSASGFVWFKIKVIDIWRLLTHYLSMLRR